MRPQRSGARAKQIRPPRFSGKAMEKQRREHRTGRAPHHFPRRMIRVVRDQRFEAVSVDGIARPAIAEHQQRRLAHQVRCHPVDLGGKPRGNRRADRFEVGREVAMCGRRADGVGIPERPDNAARAIVKRGHRRRAAAVGVLRWSGQPEPGAKRRSASRATRRIAARARSSLQGMGARGSCRAGSKINATRTCGRPRPS